MRIIRAVVENFKRVQVVQIHPSGDVVEVTGRNGQGKSSVLDAIEAALGGKDHDPSEPIRRGAERASRARSVEEDAFELDWLRGFLGRDPSCPAREVRDEVLRRLERGDS